jgi:hypothetical protein
MTIVIAGGLTLLALIIARVWWKCRRCYPTLRTIQLITMNDPLVTHRPVSYGTGIDAMVSGKTFSYRYTREWAGGVLITKLRVSFQKSGFGRPKIVLTAVFRDENVERWALADGQEHTMPNYPEYYVLCDILRIVENVPPFQRTREVAQAAHRPCR